MCNSLLGLFILWLFLNPCSISFLIGNVIFIYWIVLSINFSAIGKKIPPAPGCVDQQLTSIGVSGRGIGPNDGTVVQRLADMVPTSVHAELDIPSNPQETPYGLQILLDMFRSQYLSAMEAMKSPQYAENVKAQIEEEKVS